MIYRDGKMLLSTLDEKKFFSRIPKDEMVENVIRMKDYMEYLFEEDLEPLESDYIYCKNQYSEAINGLIDMYQSSKKTRLRDVRLQKEEMIEEKINFTWYCSLYALKIQ